MKKFELTDDTLHLWNGVVVRRVRALRAFGTVKAGTVGGYVEKESNLSQDGLCWVAENGVVYEDGFVAEDGVVGGCAYVSGRAKVRGQSRVDGAARVKDDTDIYGLAVVSEGAYLIEEAKVGGNSRIRQKAVLRGQVVVEGVDVVVSGNPILGGTARVVGNVSINGPVTLRDGEVSHNDEFLCVGPVNNDGVWYTLNRNTGTVTAYNPLQCSEPKAVTDMGAFYSVVQDVCKMACQIL